MVRSRTKHRADIRGIVLIDDDANVRAVTTAHWLVQMGWEVYALEGGIAGDGTETGMPNSARDYARYGKKPSCSRKWTAYAVAAGVAAGELALADTDVGEDYVTKRSPAGRDLGCAPARAGAARCTQK